MPVMRGPVPEQSVWRRVTFLVACPVTPPSAVALVPHPMPPPSYYRLGHRVSRAPLLDCALTLRTATACSVVPSGGCVIGRKGMVGMGMLGESVLGSRIGIQLQADRVDVRHDRQRNHEKNHLDIPRRPMHKQNGVCGVREWIPDFGRVCVSFAVFPGWLERGEGAYRGGGNLVWQRQRKP